MAYGRLLRFSRKNEKSDTQSLVREGLSAPKDDRPVYDSEKHPSHMADCRSKTVFLTPVGLWRHVLLYRPTEVKFMILLRQSSHFGTKITKVP